MTIQPISNRCISFGKITNKPKQNPVPECNDKKYVNREKTYSFLTGAMCTAVILASVHQCNEDKRDFMLNQISAELKYSDPNKINVSVSDVTQDGCLDFVIEDMQGDKSVYDLKNGHLFYYGEEGIEKIY